MRGESQTVTTAEWEYLMSVGESGSGSDRDLFRAVTYMRKFWGAQVPSTGLGTFVIGTLRVPETFIQAVSSDR